MPPQRARPRRAPMLRCRRRDGGETSRTNVAYTVRTCTAVTLYSGHEVAVSTACEVSTLDGASGKWNDRNTCPDDDRRVGRAGTTTDPRRLTTATVSPS